MQNKQASGSKSGKGKTLYLLIAVVAIIVVGALMFWFLSAPPREQPSEEKPPTEPSAPSKTFHKQVLYIIVNDEGTRINMYKTGVFDIGVVTPARWPDVNNTPVNEFSLRLVRRPDRPGLTIQYICLNPEREPLNNVNVRRALAYATPYEIILNQVFNKLYTQLHTIVPKGVPGYTEFGIEKFEYNVTKASEIIAKLKAETGFDPSKYVITIIYNEGNTARQQIASLLQQSWGQLGFKVNVEAYSWPKYLDLFDHFQYDVALLGWIPDYLDADNYLMPFVYGGAEFSEIEYHANVAAEDVGNYVSSIESIIEVEDYTVIVGPKGTGASYTGPTAKPLIIINYVVDWDTTNANWKNPISMVTLGAGGLKDITLSALCRASQRIIESSVRKAVIQAAVITFNRAVSMILMGQNIIGENFGTWVYGMYYPLSTFARYDLVWENASAPVIDTGVLDVKNDPETMVIGTIGWPDTFDPAKSYESFGWEIFWHVYGRLVTLWKEDTEPIPELAVAWAFSKDGTDLYFVMRGDVLAYDPWNGKTYPITAVDALFSVWRAVRANLPGGPQWMIDSFIDVNSSSVLTENELDSIAKTEGLIAEFKGKTAEVKSFSELLNFFGYSGKTAGVVKFKMWFPYAPILQIFVTGVGSVFPMEYALGDQYQAALGDSNNGKIPAAWANYIQPGQEDPVFLLLSTKPVSTGPYYVADYKEDSYVLLKFNPYYWNTTLWQELYSFKP
ncbi:MAG: ABC transporter substrate-binding protein [Thermofilaceae archaeon]